MRTTARRRSLRVLKLGFIALLVLSANALATMAEAPIQGGLGVNFGHSVGIDQIGAEVTNLPLALSPDNRNIQLPASIPAGLRAPWRYYLQAVLPRPFRYLDHTSYVMLDDQSRVMRAVAQIDFKGCEGDFDWLMETIKKKYKVKGELTVEPPQGYAEAYRVVFTGKQIDFRCGDNLILDYADYDAILSYYAGVERLAQSQERAKSTMAKRQLVLETRRAMRFADEFTLGDRFRILGAFGIAFGQPFAKNSTQKFPVDKPFTAVLPNLPHAFSDGEIILEISPDKEPIVIRGQFKSLSFDKVTTALRAKYGTPLKASKRHVIHKVSGNHAIIKQLTPDIVEVAFIDSNAKAAQRQRLWEQESEGV